MNIGENPAELLRDSGFKISMNATVTLISMLSLLLTKATYQIIYLNIV
jgi:hypothetical protein